VKKGRESVGDAGEKGQSRASDEDVIPGLERS
jgi:hypothetical protein